MQGSRKPANQLRPDSRLEQARRDYEALKQQVQSLDFICQGTVMSRKTLCGQPTCRCHTDRDARHGPYWELTYKVKGKTVARRLQPEEAPLYVEAAASYRRLKTLLAAMSKLSRRALDRAGRQVTTASRTTSPASRRGRKAAAATRPPTRAARTRKQSPES